MPPGGPTGPEGAMLSLVTLSYPQGEFEHAGGGGGGRPHGGLTWNTGESS